MAFDLDLLESNGFELPQQFLVEEAGIHSQQSRPDEPSEHLPELVVQFVKAVVAWQGIAAVVVRQAIGMAEASHGRYDAAWSGDPDLFAQNLRDVVDDSKQPLTGSQVKTIVGKRQLACISLDESNLPG